jgi:hypothetical protein
VFSLERVAGGVSATTKSRVKGSEELTNEKVPRAFGELGWNRAKKRPQMAQTAIWWFWL